MGSNPLSALLTARLFSHRENTMTTRDLPTNIDVVVIGAGPAGALASSLLHKAGHSVCVLERERFPRFVIGESLLPRCMDLLEEGGFLDRCREQGYIEKHGAIFLRGDERCNLDFGKQHTSGWHYTWQVPRAHFDQVLADEVQAQGVPIFFEHTVTAVEVGARPSVTVRSVDGASRTVSCRFIVDASGYGRVLPRHLGLDVASDLPVRKSLFTHIRGDRRQTGTEEGKIWIVTLAPDAWGWVIPFAGEKTSVGAVGGNEFFARHPADPEACLRSILTADPNMNARLGESEFLFEPRVIEGYSIGVKQLHGEGYCLVGNATEFLDPVFSSGVTLALESSSLAAKVLIQQLSGGTPDWDADFVDPMMKGIDTFRHYVNWWYDGTLPTIFYAEKTAAEVKEKLCSVLAGYAWDESNPFVADYKRKVPQLVRVLAL